MELDLIKTILGYGYFFLTALLVFLLYGYLYHMLKSEKSGKKSYEKYANIVLDDGVNDKPVESFPQSAKSDLNKEEQ